MKSEEPNGFALHTNKRTIKTKDNMTTEEIKALTGVDIEENEKFVKVTPQAGYRLLIRNTDAAPDGSELPDGADTTEVSEWTETDSVFLPVGCEDAPEVSTIEDDGTTDGIATTDENGEEVVTSLEERVLRLEARVSALEADLAAMGTDTDGSAAMMIDE